MEKHNEKKKAGGNDWLWLELWQMLEVLQAPLHATYHCYLMLELGALDRSSNSGGEA